MVSGRTIGVGQPSADLKTFCWGFFDHDGCRVDVWNICIIIQEFVKNHSHEVSGGDTN